MFDEISIPDSKNLSHTSTEKEELQRQLQAEMQEKLTVDKALERILGEQLAAPSEDEIAAELQKYFLK